MKHLKSALVLVLATWVLVGCRAKPAPNSGYLPLPQLMDSQPPRPFNRSYWNPNYDPSKYDYILYKPFNSEHMMLRDAWDKASEASLNPDYEKDVARLMEEFRDDIEASITRHPQNHFKLASAPGPRTLVVETAMVQVVPAKVLFTAAGFVFWEANVAAALGQASAKSESSTAGLVAIEMIVRDGQTGEIIAELADRERPKDALLNFRALSFWQCDRHVVRDWGDQLVELLLDPRTPVKPAGHWELILF